jgi:hypothetical protein
MTERIRFNIGERAIRGDDYFAVIEPVFWSVSIYDGPERCEAGWCLYPKLYWN